MGELETALYSFKIWIHTDVIFVILGVPVDKKLVLRQQCMCAIQKANCTWAASKEGHPAQRDTGLSSSALPL